LKKNLFRAGCWWLTPEIVATQEAKIRRIAGRSQPKQIVHENPISKNPITGNWLVKWLKIKALSSSPSIAKKKKKKYAQDLFI
jgi:hypothetical protein